MKTAYTVVSLNGVLNADEESQTVVQHAYTTHQLVGKGRTRSKHARPIYCSILFRNALLAKLSLQEKSAHSNMFGPNPQGSASHKKMSGYVKATNTRHVPRRLTLAVAPSPVRRTDKCQSPGHVPGICCFDTTAHLFM